MLPQDGRRKFAEAINKLFLKSEWVRGEGSISSEAYPAYPISKDVLQKSSVLNLIATEMIIFPSDFPFHFKRIMLGI